jgi:hypothetical protein
MLSRSTLKTELVAFRDGLKPAQPDDQGRLIGNRNTADVQLLNRWIARCDREDLDEQLWKAFRDAMAAPELIRLELQGRRKIQAAVNQIYGTKWEIAGGGELVGLDEEWRALQLKKRLTDNLSLANFVLLERAYDMHASYAHLMGDFIWEPRQRDRDGTRRQRLFWDFVGGYLYLRLGGWFDREVAILTEIAFDLSDGSVSSEHIADARRPR